MKKGIIGFILGAIIFGGIVGVSAYTIFANDVGYTPKDTTWEVDNVKDAIDELYNRTSNIEVIDRAFAVHSTENLSKSNAYTAEKKGKVLIFINLHSGIENVDSKSSYVVKKNNINVTPTFVNTGNWNRIIYYIIDVDKDDVVSYSASTQKAGTVDSLGMLVAFISH